MNRFRSFMIKCMVVVVISTSSAFAAPLAKVLLLGAGKEGFDKLCDSLGLKGFSKTQLERNIVVALETLNNGKMPKNDQEMANILAFDPQIANLAQKDATSELSPEEFVTVINRLNLEAELKGYKKSVLGCTSCLDPELSKLGIRSLMREASESNAKVIKAAFYPKDQREMITSIKNMARNKKLRIDNLVKSPRGTLLGNEGKGMNTMDIKPLYIALRKTLYGTKKEKALGQSIRNFNAVGDSADYSKNALWKLLVSDMSDAEMDSWIARLDAVVKENPDTADRTPILRDWFRKKSVDIPSLKKHYDELKSRDCFGLF